MSETASHVEVLAGVTGNPAIVIRVRDIPGLIKAQGGAIGELFNKLAPETIASTVYSKMAEEMKKGLSEKGVNADVQVMDLPTSGPGSPTPKAPDNTLRNVAIGGATLGGLGLLYFFFGRKPHAVPR